MKAILIDPAARSIEYVETDLSLPAIHAIVGADTLAFCRPLAFLREQLAVSDNGARESLPAFRVTNYRWPIYGKALLFGYDTAGQERPTGLSVDLVAALVEFD